MGGILPWLKYSSKPQLDAHLGCIAKVWHLAPPLSRFG